MANNSDYRVLEDHDIALNNLVVMNPQPKAQPVQSTRRTFAASGLVADEGFFVEFEWTMIETPTQYAAILGYFNMFGLPLTYTNEVTIYARNELLVYTRYNGLAVLPEVGRDGKWNDYFWRDVVVLVKNLVAI